jgi:hypothetical protein
MLPLSERSATLALLPKLRPKPFVSPPAWRLLPLGPLTLNRINLRTSASSEVYWKRSGLPQGGADRRSARLPLKPPTSLYWVCLVVLLGSFTDRKSARPCFDRD